MMAKTKKAFPGNEERFGGFIDAYLSLKKKKGRGPNDNKGCGPGKIPWRGDSGRSLPTLIVYAALKNG